MVDSVLHLRTVGGLGNRLLPLLMALDGIERSGHTLSVTWPTVYRDGGHQIREQNFPLHLSQLYDVNFSTSSDAEWVAAMRQCSVHYGLGHTEIGLQELRDPAGRAVPLMENSGNSLTVESHGWLNVDGEGWSVVLRLRKAYEKSLKLHPEDQEVFQAVLDSFRGRPTVGVYMRQLHPKLRNWDAYGRITPKMREHLREDAETAFFVISECPGTVQRLKDEFGEGRVITTPKPGIMNHPDEMKGVVVDIEVMRYVSVYYPTWGSGMARLMSAIRDEEIL